MSKRIQPVPGFLHIERGVLWEDETSVQAISQPEFDSKNDIMRVFRQLCGLDRHPNLGYLPQVTGTRSMEPSFRKNHSD